jgi:hypothetical protein
MPAPNGVPVNVTVNFQGISYNSATGQWTIPANAPSWTVPPTTAVPSGNNLITWTLHPAAVPSGFGAAFDGTTGIAFTSGWPGGTPTLQGNGTYQCTDDFTPGPNNRSYYYRITVNLTNGTVSKSFTLDPDIQNRGANPVINYVESAVTV